MKPEEEAEIILWDWLKTKGESIEEIYFNRENKLNWKKFKIQGEIKKIPDFVLKINNGYGIKYYAVEVKSSENSKNILNASKILDIYLKNYLNKTTKYFIEDKEIFINGFLIATDKSPQGYLFKKEDWIDNTIKDEGLSKYNASIKYKIIPLKEGNRTFEFIRFLWEIYSKIRNDYETKLDVGIIIGNESIPYMMITSYYNKNKRWTQRWWKI
jgi:hypothetical protein